MRIIGCGNRDRGDDGAGVLVAERLRGLGLEAEARSGEALDLIEAWSGADDVVVVDAVVTGAPAGTVQVWDGPVRGSVSTSTHGFGVAEAVRLAGALDRLPVRLRIYGIEGTQFNVGTEPSPEVNRAVEEVIGQIAVAAEHQRLRLILYGAVQGVGFRPFVYRLATELGLCGWVLNSSAGLVVEVEGLRQCLGEFEARVDREQPPAAVVLSRESERLAPAGYASFEIRSSRDECEKAAALLPDLATWPVCRRELLDPANRRFGYRLRHR